MKNGVIKNTKCLMTFQTSYSSQIRNIQTIRSTPDTFHYFQLRYIFQTIVFILKYAIEKLFQFIFSSTLVHVGIISFLNLENYIREIRLSHYRLGLVDQHINILDGLHFIGH
ncbi:hypothetical protein SAP269_11890 [Spiroplasma ixodetis]|uniref:Uncharacterized protein n=1 Tax=Spiroplasma ixodetis TaxID=2141 RepID=A0ABM8JMN1_9MOLU